MKHHGVWGTICDDDFNEDAAKVVCKRLGYKGKSAVKKDAYFGPGKKKSLPSQSRSILLFLSQM